MQFHKQAINVMMNVCTLNNMYIINNYLVNKSCTIVLTNVHKHNHSFTWKLNNQDHIV